MAHLHYSSVIGAPRSEVFDFVSDFAKLPLLMPEYLKLDLTAPPLTVQRGAEFEFKITRFGINNLWSVKIEDFKEEELFTERLIMGVFDSWVHTYRFEDHGENSTRLSHFIDYQMPFGIFGRLADDLVFRKDLSNLLMFAHRKLEKLLLLGKENAKPKAAGV